MKVQDLGPVKIHPCEIYGHRKRDNEFIHDLIKKTESKELEWWPYLDDGQYAACKRCNQLHWFGYATETQGKHISVEMSLFWEPVENTEYYEGESEENADLDCGKAAPGGAQTTVRIYSTSDDTWPTPHIAISGQWANHLFLVVAGSVIANDYYSEHECSSCRYHEACENR